MNKFNLNMLKEMDKLREMEDRTLFNPFALSFSPKGLRILPETQSNKFQVRAPLSSLPISIPDWKHYLPAMIIDCGYIHYFNDKLTNLFNFGGDDIIMHDYKDLLDVDTSNGKGGFAFLTIDWKNVMMPCTHFAEHFKIKFKGDKQC